MMSKTHAVLAVAASSLALQTAEVSALVAAAVASQLPDLDTSKSLAGRILFPVSWFLERRLPHRTVTHSFLFTFIVALLALPTAFFGAIYPKAMVLGYFCGWFGDAFTKKGVSAFYPFSAARLVVPANPRLRLRTGGGAEYFIFLLLVSACVGLVNLQSAGGMMRSIENLFAQSESAAEFFNKTGGTRRVYAQIIGRKGLSPLNAEFEIIDVSGTDLIVSDGDGNLFLAGDSPVAKIHIESVTTRAGEQIVTELRELRFNDEDLQRKLAALHLAPHARCFLTGELTAEDFSLDATPINSLEHFNALTISGETAKTIRLRSASIADLQRLGRVDVRGSVLARIVTVKGE